METETTPIPLELGDDFRELRKFFKLTPELFCIAGFDGRFKRLSPAWVELLGWPVEALLDKPFLDFVHPGDRARTAEVAARIGDGETVTRFENRYVRSDGSVVWLQWKAAPDPRRRLIYACAHDVTRERRAQAALRLSEERFRTLAGATSDAVYDWNLVTGQLWWNDGIRRIFALESPDVDGWTDRLHPEDRERVLHGVQKAVESGSEWADRYRFRHGDGRWLDVEDRARVIRDVGGRAVRFVGAMRDVTDRARTERLKDELISTASHELRTPLTALLGAVRLLESGRAGALPESARMLLEVAAQSGRQLARLVDDLLDVEKMSSGRLTVRRDAIDAAGVAEEVVVALRDYASTLKVRLELEASEPAPVLGDADRLRQVLNNLVSNAIKFSPAGGVVTLRAVGGRITVQDRGPGIPEAFRARIFERFAQADGSSSRAQRGTGLGLAISKGLMERMGGQIGFETGAGGTAFWVQLPRA